MSIPHASPNKQTSGHTWKVDPVSGITGGRDLYSVSLDASGDVGFAVGGDGLVLRWDGHQWKADGNAMALANGKTFLDVAVAPTGKQALAIGDAGMVLNWNGKTWKHDSVAEKLAMERSLFALDFDNQGHTAWIVGQYGIALHWNGSQWKRTPTPFTPPGHAEGGAPVDSFGMWSVSIEPNGVDAVATGNGNRILRWNGKAWKDDPRAPNLRSPGDAFAGMHSIAMSKNGKRGWMVGNVATVLMWSGSKWQQMPTSLIPSDDDNGTFFSVACDGTGDTAFAVSSTGELGRWDGKKWTIDTSVPIPAEGRMLSDVALNEKGNVGFAVGQQGFLLRWDGKGWKRDPVGERPIYGEFSSIAMSPDGKSGLAVSYRGIPLRWDGTSWKADESRQPKNMRLGTVWMAPSGQSAFGAGEDGIYRWNGSGWTAEPSVRSLHVLALNEKGDFGFAGNIMGKVYRYDGTRWAEDKQASEVAGGHAIWAMYLSPDGKLGFAAGSDIFLRWDGTAWRKDVNLSKWPSYTTIRVSKKGNVGFVIGSSPDGHSVMRWNGSAWRIDPVSSKLFGDSGPYNLALSDDGQTGIAISFQGPVLYWNGKKWSPDTNATNLAQGQHPISVWLDPAGKSGWVLGWKGFLMRFQA